MAHKAFTKANRNIGSGTVSIIKKSQDFFDTPDMIGNSSGHGRSFLSDWCPPQKSCFWTTCPVNGAMGRSRSKKQKRKQKSRAKPRRPSSDHKNWYGVWPVTKTFRRRRFHMDMFVVLTVFTGAGIVFAGFGTILMVRHVHHYSGLWLTVAGLASAVIAGGSAIHQQWQSKYRIWNVRLLGMLVVV